jgi:hypothetical protein
MDAGQELTALHKFLYVVTDDVKIAVENVENDPSQFHRRTLIRTIFTAVEGLTHLIKQQALGWIQSEPDLYIPPEIAMLREETYGLDSKGDVHIQSKFLRTDENFRFAMKMYMRGCSASGELEVGDSGWSFFKQSLSVRHRITHPKQAEDLDISDSELEIAKNAFRWFMSTMNRKLLDGVTSLRTENAKLEAERNDLKARLIEAQRRGPGRPRKGTNGDDE